MNIGSALVAVQRRWTSLVLVLGALAIAYHPALLGLSRVGASTTPAEYVESFVVIGAESFRAGGFKSLYRADWDDAPYMLTQYPPAMYLLWAAGSELLGRGPDFFSGRLLGFLGWAVAMAFGIALVTRMGVSPAVAGAIVACHLVTSISTTWLGIGRVEVPGLALCMVGLWVLLRVPSRRGALLAGCAFAFALAFKQSLLAAPLSAMLYLLGEKRFRHAIELFFVIAIPVSIGAVLVNMMTDGGLLLNTLDPLHQAIIVGTWDGYLLDLVGTFPMPGIILVAAAPVLFISWRGPARLLTLFTLLSVAQCAASMGKVGANTNYLIQPQLAVFMAAAVGVSGSVRRLRWSEPVRDWLVWGASVLILAAAMSTIPGVLRERGKWERTRAVAPVSIDIPQRPGLVMMSPIWFPASGLPVEKLYWNDPYGFSHMAVDGRIDQHRISADLRSGRISVVVARGSLNREPRGEPRFPGDYWRGWSEWWVGPWLDAARDCFRGQVDFSSRCFVYTWGGCSGEVVVELREPAALNGDQAGDPVHEPRGEDVGSDEPGNR